MSKYEDCEIVDGVHGHEMLDRAEAQEDEVLDESVPLFLPTKFVGAWFDSFPLTALRRLKPARRRSLQGRRRQLDPAPAR